MAHVNCVGPHAVMLPAVTTRGQPRVTTTIVITAETLAGFFTRPAALGRGRARVACNRMLPHADNVPNKFGILKERHYSDEKTVRVALKTHPTTYNNNL